MNSHLPFLPSFEDFAGDLWPVWIRCTYKKIIYKNTEVTPDGRLSCTLATAFWKSQARTRPIVVVKHHNSLQKKLISQDCGPESLFRRGVGFIQQKIDWRLEHSGQNLSLCQEKLDHVMRLHEQQYPWYKRTIYLFQRKFGSFHSKIVPTEDPFMP